MRSLNTEAYPPHLLAQRLNNRGSAMIEKDQYDQAIETLIKALKFSEQSANETPCGCSFCSLHACISSNQPSVPTLSQPESQTQPKRAGRRFQCTEVTTDTSLLDDRSVEHGGFIYRRPLRVDTNSMEEGHNMGVKLSVVIIFNLALAHQLSAGAHITSTTLSATSLKVMQKALQLYELAYQLHLDELQESNQYERVGSVRFTLIVSNNLGEIHRAAGNKEKHEMCLSHLLQTIMYLVDCQIVIDSVELDGFLQNASRIMFPTICARAA